MLGNLQMTTTATTTTTSSSSSSSSCHRERNGMDEIGHPPLHHAPPPSPTHFIRKKHHHRHHHPHHLPPPPPPHCRLHFAEHPDLSPPLHCPHHHHGKLRLKPPKPSKKVRKLHRKLLKAYKLPKSPRHCRHHHHMHFPPPKDGCFSTCIGDRHPPGCCLHSMEAERFSSEKQCHLHGMEYYNPHRHGGHPHHSNAHKTCPMRPSIKSEIVAGGAALLSPPVAEAPAEPSTEHNIMPLVSAMPPADEIAPATLAP